MGMIQQAFNQMLASGLAASYTIQRSPYYKAQQEAKTALKEADIAKAKAFATTTEAATSAALDDTWVNVKKQEEIVGKAEEARKSAQEAALDAQYKAGKLSKEDYATQYAKLQQPTEMTFQDVIQETIENDPSIKAAVEAQIKAQEEAQARIKAIEERHAAISELKKLLMEQGVAAPVAERAAIEDYERSHKK